MLNFSVAIKHIGFVAFLVSALALSACNDDKKAEAPAAPAATEQAAKPAETKPADTAAAETKPAETAAAETKPVAPAAVEVPVSAGAVDVAALMAPGALPEMSIGSADAKVTIVEYASMTCGHCGAFHASTYPALKEKYVDTGKVRFVFREFPFDPLAEAGFMLARCNEAQYFPMLSALFLSQSTWVKAEKPSEALFQISKQAGYSQETFNACLQYSALLENIRAGRAAGEKLGVESTPTFFINGEKYPGNKSIEAFSAIIDPLLK